MKYFLNSSFDQLNLEDEIEDYQLKYSECYDFVDPYNNSDIEPLMMSLFEKEVINVGKEQEFEEFMK